MIKSMKKIFTIAAIAAASILAVSCAKVIEGGSTAEGITASASLQPLVVTKAIGQYSYNVVWEKEDRIGVLDNSGKLTSFKLTDGVGTSSGLFQQEGQNALSAPLTAYYPASVVKEGKVLEWPALQPDVKNIANTPMTAGSSVATGDVNFAFKHLGSILQLFLTAKNGTIDVKQIDITADQGLSGAFTVESSAAVISSTGTTITTGDISDKNIKLSATTSYLNFAVPAGDFTNFKITITDVNDNEYLLSAKSLTLQRAMVNKVTFALDAKDPARFEFTVNGHTVTVKLHKGTPSIDVLLAAGINASDNTVNILSVAKSGRVLMCRLDDGQTVEPIVDGNYYKFIISDVTKDITATIRYESYKLKAFVYPSYSGTIISEYETEHQPGDNITLEVTSSGKLGEGGKFVGWKDKDGNLISEQTSINFDIESDAFPVAVFDVNYGIDAPLGGVFTVAADKGDGKPKKIRFSKGNLYCSGASFDENGKCTSVSDDQWFMEQHQYDYGGNWDGGTRISHFLWSKDCMRSLDKTYDGTGASNQDVFFTNSTNFAVNGVSAWHTLSQPEWAYLLGDSTERSGKYRTGVTVNGVMGLVIAPDKFSGTIGNTYDATDWATAEINDGLVFLPAAGSRFGSNGITDISNAGSYGYYWSASPINDLIAFDLDFNSGDVYSNYSVARDKALSVRLVTDATE